MRLEWVQRRLQEWAAWVEMSRGYVKPLKMSDTPGGGSGEAVPKSHKKEEEVQRTLRSLYWAEEDHVSAETLVAVYLTGPREHKTTLADIARLLEINENTLRSRLEIAEYRFANYLGVAKANPRS